MTTMTDKEKSSSKTLPEVAFLFLKLGLIGFGGPAAHIALMEREVVQKRGWMSQQYFLDLMGATNLIPGPNSTEMTMHCGMVRAGWRGLVVAGACFIVPAVLITAFFGWAYQRYGQLPQVAPFIYGIKPAIIAVVAMAMVSLARRAVKSVFLAVLGTAAVVAVLAGVNELLVFFAAGLLGIMGGWSGGGGKLNGLGPLPLLQAAGIAVGAAPLQLFWIFLKIGSVLYGSGYVLFAFLDAELVGKGLLSHQQLADAIAVGQFTPGPVFSAATFIGWQIGGWQGALAATAGIFLPAFVFVALLHPLVPRLRQGKLMSAFLDAVNVASVAVVLAVLVTMGQMAFTDWPAVLIAVVSFGVLFFYPKVNSALIVLGGALAGYLSTLLF